MADIIDVVTQSGSFTTLVSSLNKAGLTDNLRGPGPFTLFAPTDDAFNNLPPGTLDNLLKNPAMLRNVLLYHVVPSRVTSDDIKGQNINAARTMEGENITIDTSLLGRVKVDNATVTRADIVADNGIIHVIDEVLLPSSMRRQRAA
ncbi:MAG TPA: fasciclin domain-containing protein [Armatimonadota bacterium]|nr:fasciclin domain-containing protein [Armatimonadota bacterium]